MLRFCSLGLKIMEKNVEIREAVREDCPEIRGLIQELADFEEMPDGPKIDYLTLEKDGFLSENPLYKCYVAVCDDVIIGYALYFFIYFTLDQKVLHLEDIYVMPDFRKKSVGSRLFNAVAKKTFEDKCSYLDFSVLSWNPAQSFYKNKGSIDMTEIEGWHMYRIDNLKNFTLSTISNNYTIRKADLKDFNSIKKLAQETNSQKIKNKNKDIFLKLEDSEKNFFSENNSNFGYLIVEMDKNIVGYALYCFAYSTWRGKSMYLQEFHVSPNEYESSMKNDLLSSVVKTALDENCIRIDFWILDYKNKGQFYASKGANDLTVKEEWHLYRLFEPPKQTVHVKV